MTTKFGIGIVFRKAQVSAKYNCPTSTITLFSEYGGGGGGRESPPQSYKAKEPGNSGGTIGYNYPCYVRRRGWMPTGLLFIAEFERAANIKKIAVYRFLIRF